MNELDLADWRRKTGELYVTVRAALDPRLAWQTWVLTRDQMFRTHPQSPIPEERKGTFQGVYFPYNDDARVLGRVRSRAPEHHEIVTSGDTTMSFTCFADVEFELSGRTLTLEVYWLKDYAGGIYLPFRDATGGHTTYGGGRYLFDSAKGADLGLEGDELILDFNFAYNPSCAYDPRWVCPLTPPPNRLEVPIEAGEMHGESV